MLAVLWFAVLCLLCSACYYLATHHARRAAALSDGGWKMPASCGPDPAVVPLHYRNWMHNNYELDKTASYPPAIVKQLFHAPDHDWQFAVENGSCDNITLAKYKVTCKRDVDGRKVFKFPPGSMFEITKQIVLSPNTVIEGAGNPNPGGALGDHRLRPNPKQMTLFWSQPSANPALFIDGEVQWCGCSWDNGTSPCKVASPEAYQLWRKGFLMNTNTTARMFLFDGAMEDGMDDCDGGLGGGGAFELPGCLTSNPAPKGMVGCGVKADFKTPVHKGMTEFVSGDGKAVENVLIEDIRLADGLAGYGFKSMMAFWSAFPPDGSMHKNVTVRRLVSMGTGKDGLNIHGPVDGFTGEDIYIERANDDTFVIWGAGGAPFFNNRSRNIKLNRLFARYYRSWDPIWGTCLSSYGFGGTLTVDQLMCCQDVAGDELGPNKTCSDMGKFQNGQHAVTFQPGFNASYSGASATVTNVVWWNTTTNTSNCRKAHDPAHPQATAFCPSGFGPFSAPKLVNDASQWCKRGEGDLVWI